MDVNGGGGGGNIRGVRRSDGESASQSISQRYSVELKVQSWRQPDGDPRRGGAEREERVNRFRALSCAVPVSLLSPPSEESTRGGPRRSVGLPGLSSPAARALTLLTQLLRVEAGQAGAKARCFYEIKPFKVDPSGRKEEKRKKNTYSDTFDSL